MKISRLSAVFVALSVAMGLFACDKYTSSGQTVGQKVDQAIDKSNQQVADVRDKVGATVENAGNAASAVANTVSDKAAETSTAIADGTITASIKADLLKDPDISVLKIDVDTRNGVVALNGLTKDDAARLRAEKIASAIKGVTKVNNHLVVKIL